ncbi:MAG: DUF899 family protein [Alphaproteobacteria bacterium]
MSDLHDKRFPNESAAYRNARADLLTQELELRRTTEKLAAARRALPRGGALKEDYVFEGPNGQIKFSDLFEDGKKDLLLYSFMFNPAHERPCPACTSCMDAVDGNARYVNERANFWIAAKAPLPKMDALAKERGWRHLCYLSSNANSYNADYFGETAEGAQQPMLNVFEKTAEGIFHVWGSELLYAPDDPGQHSRHIDMMWPLWNMLDQTRSGRGDFFPSAVF